MSESKDRKNRKAAYPKGGKQKNTLATPFYGALKSNNEIYFQMASLFKEVTKDEKKLSGQWMDRILSSQSPNIPGKIFMDNI